MTFKIDKGIPIPANRGRGGANTKYPFRELRVGHSFFEPNPKPNFAATISSAGKRMGRKFSAMTVTEDGIKGKRVWRVE